MGLSIYVTSRNGMAGACSFGIIWLCAGESRRHCNWTSDVTYQIRDTHFPRPSSHNWYFVKRKSEPAGVLECINLTPRHDRQSLHPFPSLYNSNMNETDSSKNGQGDNSRHRMHTNDYFPPYNYRIISRYVGVLYLEIIHARLIIRMWLLLNMNMSQEYRI